MKAHARDVLRVFGQPPPVARAVLGAHESERPATALGHVIDVKPLAVIFDLPHLHGIVVRFIPAPAATGDRVFGRAPFIEMQDRRVQRALGPLPCRRENARQRGVPILERVERQTRLAVLVFQHPGELLGRIRCTPPLGQPRRQAVDLPGVVGGRAGRIRVARAETQIEHERQSMPLRDRRDLMLAVGVERGERQLGRFAGGHVDYAFAFMVANDKLPPGAGGRERDRQRGDHAAGLLGVAVGRKETARFVDQQLVELRVEPVRGATEAVRRGAQNSGERGCSGPGARCPPASA